MYYCSQFFSCSIIVLNSFKLFCVFVAWCFIAKQYSVLCTYKVCFSYSPLMGIWIASICCIMSKLLWIFQYKSFFRQIFSFTLGKYKEMGLLSLEEVYVTISKKIPKYVSKQMYYFSFSLSMKQCCQSFKFYPCCVQ